ncbi:MAG TPA: TldD/PmbA family protein [Spirochaetia bacterium]|nr:TldD/PmbA family protein [Spirochaetia bacterium]
MSKNLTVDKSLLKEALAAALAKGGDFADIFVEHKRATSISLEDARIERVQSGVDNGAGVRAICGDTTAYAYTNDLSREGLVAAAETVAQAARGGREQRTIDLGNLTPHLEFKVKQRPDEVEVAAKTGAVEAADRAARAVDREKIRQVMAGYGDVIQEVIIANSDGVYVEDERIRTRMVIQVVAADGALMQTGLETAGGVAGFELLSLERPEEMAERAASRAVAMLKAPPAPAGKMPVVMAGEAGGTMIHEACGHGLEADLVLKGLSVYGGKVGQEVASPEITVIDDATLPGRYGSYRFDDEGTPAETVVLIEKGRLKDYLFDRFSAQKEGRRSNGHGRRESYQHKPITRMANTYIDRGDLDPEKIIREAGHGLLVRKMGGGQVNTTTGDFMFEVAEGYLIKDGKTGPMVRGATLTGNGPEVLNQVTMVGNDLGFGTGTCGKDGQGVPVGDAQPTLAIREMVVGGMNSPQGGPGIRRL